MSSHHLSLSKWHLAKQCSYWARPDVELPYSASGRPARVGTITHRLSDAYARALRVMMGAVVTAEQLLAVPAVRAVDEAEDEYAEALAIFNGPLHEWISQWDALPVQKTTELRLRYDARSDRVWEPPRRGEAGYTRPLAYEVTGELDFVRIVDDCVEVIDLKTGKFSDSAVAQLDAYSMLASRMFGVSRARHRVLYARKTKIVETPWVEMDADALDAEAGAITRVLRRLPTVAPTRPAESRTCSFICPLGRAACPAWADREADMPGDDYFGDREVA